MAVSDSAQTARHTIHTRLKKFWTALKLKATSCTTVVLQLYYSCTVKMCKIHFESFRYYKKVRKHCKSTECMKGIRAMNKCNTKSQQRIAVKCVALRFQQPAPSTENVQHAGSGTDARLGTQCAELPHIDQCSQQGLTDSIAGVQHPGTQCMLYGHWHFLVEQFL